MVVVVMGEPGSESKGALQSIPWNSLHTPPHAEQSFGPCVMHSLSV